jgi:dienelactone hydrolase
MSIRAIVATVTVGTLVACSSTDEGQPAEIVMERDCVDALEAVFGDPGEWDQQRGTIIKCAEVETLSQATIQQTMEALDYNGPPLTSGARVYRVLYGTTRGNGAAGYSSAAVYLPDRPAAEQVPAVVVSHGSRGQAQRCASSLLIPELDSLNEDQLRIVYTIVGAGMPVIAPDLAGYANYGAEGNPPPTYNTAIDVGRSTLDGAAALRQLIPSRLKDEVVITGFSQGGHTALSALAHAENYGLDGTLAGVVAYAPLWMSQRTWGALTYDLVAGMYPIADEPNANAVSVWYHYTKGELLDGPGGGLEVFAPDKREGIKRFVEETCWAPPYESLESLGRTAADLFSDEFRSAVSAEAALGMSGCPAEEPGASLCKTWIERYQQDRPHFTGQAASTPLLLVYGGLDETVPPDRFQCVLDRLAHDEVNGTQCFDPEADHGTIPARSGAYVAQWILHQTLGAPLTASCPADEIELINKSGSPVSCASPPPND